GIDRRHVARAAIGSWPGDAQAFALADGESVHPVVGGQHRAVGTDYRATANRDALAQKSAGVSRRNEADVVAVRLVGDRQAATGSLGSNLRLEGVPDREY